MPEFLKRTKEELEWVAIAITIISGVYLLNTTMKVSAIEALTFAGIFVLMITIKNGFNETVSKLEEISREIRNIKQSSSAIDPEENNEEKKRKEKEPIKTTGFGAFGGMLIGGAIGLVFGTLGVLVGGILGAIIGDEWERMQIRERKKRKEEAQIIIS